MLYLSMSMGGFAEPHPFVEFIESAFQRDCAIYNPRLTLKENCTRSVLFANVMKDSPFIEQETLYPKDTSLIQEYQQHLIDLSNVFIVELDRMSQGSKYLEIAYARSKDIPIVGILDTMTITPWVWNSVGYVCKLQNAPKLIQLILNDML